MQIAPSFLMLPERVQVALLGVFRGPDAFDELSWALKRLIVSRCRSMVVTDYPYGEYDTTPVTVGSLAAFRDCIRAAATQTPVPPHLSVHFLNHLDDALSWTADHPAWGGVGSVLVDVVFAMWDRNWDQATQLLARPCRSRTRCANETQ